jgi:hypothetical protein
VFSPKAYVYRRFCWLPILPAGHERDGRALEKD